MSIYDSYIAELFIYNDEQFHTIDLEVDINSEAMNDLKVAFDENN